jgi:hypothetical protein
MTEKILDLIKPILTWCTISSDLDFFADNGLMRQASFRHALTVVILFVRTCCASSGVAQKVDAEFLRAISTIYAGGFTGQIIKEWCDERVPSLSDQNANVLEVWRKKMELPLIDERLVGLIGADGKDKVTASLEDKRSAFYDQLDKSSTNPETDCVGLGQALNDDFNLKVLYADEYKIVAARAAGNSGAGLNSTGSNSTGANQAGSATASPGQTGSSKSPAQTTTSSKLLTLPPFDFASFAKLGLDPEYNPIPDEYRCYARTPGDQYATPNAILHVLAGRKYRFAYAGTIYEGTFVLKEDSVVFNSGLLVNQNKDYTKYNFDRRTGASINLQELRLGERKFDFFCPQRGAADQLEQLRFKRKDPQPGSFACAFADDAKPIGDPLEILPNRRYRTDGGEGSYRVDITGENTSSSKVEFLDGPIEGRLASYEERNNGEQSFSLYQRPAIRCNRKVNPRANLPVFGPNKAPPAPGKGGLEGRFFMGRSYTDANGSPLCGGACYEWAFFQKDGYVYTDDAEDTGGLEDINCAKTYPSGFPVCQTYTITDNTIKIGFGKPVAFKRIGKTVEIDGDEYGVLENLDGLKFDGYYASVTGTSSSNGMGSSGMTSSVDLVLRQNGRFSRDASSNSFSSASWQGETTVLASSNSSSSNTGTYRVYGNTIEFKYADGRVVKQFIFSPSGRKDLEYLRIDGRLYWLEKDQK